MAKDYEVVYRAIADFSQLRKEADSAERRLEKLERRAERVESNTRKEQKKSADVTALLADVYDDASDAVDDYGDSLDGMGRRLRSLGGSVEDFADKFDDLGDSLERSRDRSKKTGFDLMGLVAIMDDIQGATADSAAAFGDLDVAADRTSTTLRRTTRDADETDRSSNRLRQTLARLASLFSGLGSRTDGLSQNLRRFGQAIKDVLGSGGGEGGGGGGLGGLSGGFSKAAKNAAKFGTALLGLAKIGGIASLIGLAVNAVNALGAGLVGLTSSLGPLLGLLNGLPGALSLLGAPLATLIVGFTGLGDAVGAFIEFNEQAADSSASAAAAATAQAQAQEVASRQAARAREQAARRIEQAERGLASAQDRVTDAQDNLNEARETAAERLEELERLLERQPLLEGRAELNVAVAERRLLETISDPGATAIDRREAEVGLEEARAELNDTQRQGVDLEEELAEAREDGIEGADNVVAAQEALAAAIEGVADAEEGLSDARQGQIDLLQQQALVTAQAAAEVDELQDALKDLGPEGRAFAEFLASLKPILVDFRQAVQANLLPPVQRAIGILVDRLLPLLQDRMATLAAAIGPLFTDLAERLTDSESLQDFSDIFDMVTDAMAPLGRAVNTFIESLVSLAAAGRPIVDWLVDVIGRWSRMFANFVEVGRETGDLQRSMEDAIDAAQRWGEVLANVWSALSGTFGAAREQGSGMLDDLIDLTQRWEDWTESIEGQNAIADWVAQARPVLAEIGRFIGALGQAFVDVAQDADNSLIPVLAALREDVLPRLVEFLTIFAGEFALKLVELVTHIADFVLLISQNGGVLQAFVGTLNLFLDAVIGLVENVPWLGQAVGILASFAGVAGAVGLVTKALKPLTGLLSAVGGALMKWPAFASGVGALRGAFVGLASRAAPALAGMAAAAAIAATAADALWGTRQTDASRSYADAVVAGSDTAVGALDALREAQDSLADDLSGATGAFDWLYFDSEAESARENLRSVEDRMRELLDSPDLFTALADPDGAQAFGDTVQGINARIAELREVAEQGGRFDLGPLSFFTDNEAKNAQNEIDRLTGLLHDMGPATDEALQTLNAFNAQLRADNEIVDFQQSIEDISAEFGFSESALRSLVDNGYLPAEVRAGDLETAQDELRDAASRARQAIEDQRDALQGMTDPVFRVVDAQGRLADAQQRVNDLRADATASDAEVAEAERRAVEAAFALDDALFGLQDAYISGELSADGFRAAIERQVDLGRITREQADLMIANLGDATTALDDLRTGVETPLTLAEVNGDPMIASLERIYGRAVQTVDSIWASLDDPSHASMGAAIAAAEQGGEEVASTHDSWMSQAVATYQNATDEMVGQTETAAREVHTTWEEGGRDITEVFTRFEADSGRIATSTYDLLAVTAKTGLGNVEAQWDRHPGEVTVPVNQVIRGPVNLGIVSAWNHIASVVGEPTIAPHPLVALNSGGTVTDPFGRTSTAPNSDSVLTFLTPGEEVINQNAASANRPLLKYINAGGKVLGDGQGFNTSGLNKGRSNADQYNLSAAMGNNPYAQGSDPAKIEGADHDGPGSSTRGFGGVKPWVAQAGHHIREKFGVRDIGGVGARANASDHPSGHALDFMVYTDAAKGDAIAEHMAANAGHYAVKYIIWWQHINQGNGWKPMADRGSITANHYDHPHVSFNRNPAQSNDVFGAGTTDGGIFSGGGSIGFLSQALDDLAAQQGTIDALMAQSDPGSFARLTGTVGQTMLDKARDFISAQASMGMGSTAKAVEEWAPTVLQALDIMGLSSGYLGTTLRRMNQESGGDPNVVNRWDSNWKKGTPSVGLMQVIGPTYKTYKHPEYDVGPYSYGTSVNPLANTLASMRYALDRYGSLPAAYDRAGGYDSGGFINKGYNLLYSGLNEPELVSPVPIMREALRTEFEDLAARPNGLDFVRGLAGAGGLQMATTSRVSAAVGARGMTSGAVSIESQTASESVGTQIQELHVHNPKPEPTSATLPRTIRRMAYST